MDKKWLEREERQMVTHTQPNLLTDVTLAPPSAEDKHNDL